MQKLKFISDGGNIECVFTYKQNIPKEKVDAIFRSCMLHIETSLDLYLNKPIFEGISKLRGEFFTKVLKFLVDDNLNHGHEIPRHILQHLTKNKQSNWCYEED